MKTMEKNNNSVDEDKVQSLKETRQERSGKNWMRCERWSRIELTCSVKSLLTRRGFFSDSVRVCLMMTTESLSNHVMCAVSPWLSPILRRTHDLRRSYLRLLVLPVMLAFVSQQHGDSSKGAFCLPSSRRLVTCSHTVAR